MPADKLRILRRAIEMCMSLKALEKAAYAKPADHKLYVNDRSKVGHVKESKGITWYKGTVQVTPGSKRRFSQAGVMVKFFPAHDWKSVDELYKRGWSDPTKVFSWPKSTMPDYLANYFGVQVAYFFHFFSVFTKCLVFSNFIFSRLAPFAYMFQDLPRKLCLSSEILVISVGI